MEDFGADQRRHDQLHALLPGGNPWALDDDQGSQVLLADGQANTTVVASPTGTVSCKRFYNVFGDVDTGASTCADASTTNQIWYRGGQQDENDKTYQYGSRHYSPDTATWTAPDTARPNAATHRPVDRHRSAHQQPLRVRQRRPHQHV